MAFCTNCGANLPDGSSFCTSCGARLSAPAGRASARPAPAYAGAPAPRPAKKSHAGLILGIVAAVLVVGIVLGILFLTGVLGGAKGPVGTWTLASSTNSALTPGNVTLVLDKEGRGYVSVVRSYFDSYDNVNYTSTYSAPVIWTESMLMVSSYTGTYTRDGDSMTLMFDGDTLFLTRTDKSIPKRTALKPGTYTLARALENGQDYSSEYTYPGSMTLVINENGFGTLTTHEETVSFTWDKYFLTSGGSPLFYTYDGSTLTLTAGYHQLFFTPMG